MSNYTVSAGDDLYLKLDNNRAIIVGPDEDGIFVSVHLVGGHALGTMTREQAVTLLNYLKTILEPQNA